MSQLLELTVYDVDGGVDYRFTGTQAEIDTELSTLDPGVETSVEVSPWNSTVQSARALSEANTAFNE